MADDYEGRCKALLNDLEVLSALRPFLNTAWATTMFDRSWNCARARAQKSLERFVLLSEAVPEAAG